MARNSVERRDVIRITGGSVVSGILLGGESETAKATTQDVSILADSLSNPPTDTEVEISNDNIRFIEADPEHGFYQPYLLYTPSAPLGNRDESERSLVVEPNARSTGDFEVILPSAVRNITSGIPGRLADQMDTPLLYPLFPESDQPGYVKVLDTSAFPGERDEYTAGPETLENEKYERYDLQLLAMVEDVQKRLADAEYEISDTIHLNGASSSATFVARFTILHPERVAAVSAGITGVFTLPKERVDSEVPAINERVEGKRLPYPVGVADLESLAGKPFNKEAWKNVDKYCYIGSADRPDPEEEPRKYRSFGNLPDDLQKLLLNVYGTERIDERFAVTRSVYQAVDPAAEFTTYEGYGHTTAPARTDVIEFHLDSRGMERRNLTGIPFLDDLGVTVRQLVIGAGSFIGGTGYVLHRLESSTDDTDS